MMHNNIRIKLKTLLAYAVVIPTGVLLGVPCLVIACLPLRIRQDNRVYYWCAHMFYTIIMWALPVSVTVKGQENITQPAIIAANHLSALDIPCIGSALGCYPHVWMFWAKYARVPLFGFIVRRMNIPLDLKSKNALMGAMRKAIALGDERKRHIIIFPEGGRARKGAIDPFWPGFAVIAEKTKLPVIPVRLYNLEKVFPPGAFWVQPYPVTMIIGKPMFIKDNESREEFVQRVQAWVEEPTL